MANEEKKLTCALKVVKYTAKSGKNAGKQVSAWRGVFFINGVRYQIFTSGNRVPDKDNPKDTDKDTLFVDISTGRTAKNSM